MESEQKKAIKWRILNWVHLRAHFAGSLDKTESQTCRFHEFFFFSEFLPSPSALLQVERTRAENTLNWSYRNWSILYRAHSYITDMCPQFLITLLRHDTSCRFARWIARCVMGVWGVVHLLNHGYRTKWNITKWNKTKFDQCLTKMIAFYLNWRIHHKYVQNICPAAGTYQDFVYFDSKVWDNFLFESIWN